MAYSHAERVTGEADWGFGQDVAREKAFALPCNNAVEKRFVLVCRRIASLKIVFNCKFFAVALLPGRGAQL